ncbi:MAG: rod shape-determining protein MreC [Candidatus Doudnabacteria bacterium]|nr:rod shape-determining protein MreC [Candidatus Doudnabacteria bacterium]
MRFIYTKAFAIFFACLVLLVFLVFFQTKGWLDPVRNAVLQSPRPVIYLVKGVVSPVKTFFSTVYRLKDISSENTRLNSRVLELQQNLVQYEEVLRENETLTKELGFVKNSKQSLVACTVLSHNPFGLTDSLVLNCGTESGVIEGQAAISQGYMVGKVIYSGKNSSTILLSTSSKFSTDAKVSQTNASAIVKGSFGSGLILDQVPQSTDLQKGFLAVTAGINDKIPKDILIGEVGDIVSTSNDLFKRASLVSPADFENLQFVFIVKQ